MTNLGKPDSDGTDQVPLKGDEAIDTKAGSVAILGRPNVGKSTLLNHIAGEKVAIVSPKPQTTRNRIVAVCERGQAQIVFVDAPGVHQPKERFNEFMVNEAREAARDADVVMVMVDASKPPTREDSLCADIASHTARPTVLVLNKVDRLAPPVVGEVVAEFRALGEFDHGLPISATLGMNTNLLLDKLVELLPAGPWLYPKGTLTDTPIKFHIAELIREQILAQTHEEIPYSVAVLVDEMEERSNGITYIKAIISVERPSQKGIIIGEKGKMLKDLGQLARAEIEALLEKRVYLDLWVKVVKNWRKKDHLLRRLGYPIKSGKQGSQKPI